MKRILLALFVVLVITPTKAQVGNIVRDTILGVPCQVYLPLHAANQPDKKWPVLYLQHGMFGSEDDWAVQGHLLHWLDSLLQQKAIEERIIIMPDNFLGSIEPAERAELMAKPNISPNGETFDVSKGSAHWRKLTTEQERAYETSGYWEAHFDQFMAEVERKYPVTNNPNQRAIAGLSMGGYHTMRVSSVLKGQFAYIGMFSAATFVHQADPNAKLLWIGMGKEDFLYEPLQSYRQWLDANGIKYTYYESEGGHTWPNWQDYLCRFLQAIHACR